MFRGRRTAGPRGVVMKNLSVSETTKSKQNMKEDGKAGMVGRPYLEKRY